jgi:hypothetical protein
MSRIASLSRRTGLTALLVGMVAALAAVVMPTTASAACAPSGVDYYFDGGGGWWYGYDYVSSERRFQESEVWSYLNNSDSPINWTRESEVTRTFTFSTSMNLRVSDQYQFITGFNRSVEFNQGQTSSYSEVTRLKQAFTYAVLPRTEVRAAYGVVHNWVGAVLKVFYKSTCALQGQTGVEYSLVPTIEQRWEFNARPV